MNPDIVERHGRVVLAYDKQALTGDAAARDVLLQMAAVEEVLRRLELQFARLPADLNLAGFKRRLRALRPDVVVNLVESLDGSDRLQTVIPLLLEDWRQPFTGSGSLAMQLSNHKIASKRLLLENRLPVPAGAWLENGVLRFLPEQAADRTRPGAWILKTLESHASLFLDDSSVIAEADNRRLAECLARVSALRGQPFFAEEFIDGREFNLSLIENRGKPVVLPPAEISFAGLPAGRPRIVGYAAKWEEESAEYQGTPRVFPGSGERELTDRLSALALSAWKAFGLSGYARVDFRVDAAGRPFILEANANPCLAPDAGLAAAAAKGGLSFTDLIARILRAAK